MLTALKRFLWDDVYAVQKVRSAVMFVGLLVGSGVIPLPANNTAGGWYAQKVGAALLAACAVFARGGDRNAGAKP